MPKVTIKFRFCAYFCNAIKWSGSGCKRHKELHTKNVPKADLLSKDWCNLIFLDRNKEYGAYVLRKNAGRRYAWALVLVTGGVLLFSALFAIAGFYIRSTVRNAVSEIEAVVRLTPLKPEDGHEFKNVSAGRRALPQMKPGATMSQPEIVETPAEEKPIGIDGPATNASEQESTAVPTDTIGQGRTDLPIEGERLTATEVVEEMPEFPGGISAFMKWMDSYVIYPPECVKRKIEGDVEVSFLVDGSGKVLHPEISKPAYPALDSAAIRAVRQMPRWQPGRKNGRVTTVRISVPIHFQLR